jgi:molecular chaperone GrpE
MNDKWLRTLADLDNYKKRIERERARWSDEAREEILLEVVDVVDDFERAVACGEDQGPPADDPYRRGVELILQRLRAVLEKNGVHAIDTCGAEFDPSLHEAVSQVETGAHESNQIVEEVRRGYTLGGRLLRCSRVIVEK